jgi:hypothetical protein
MKTQLLTYLTALLLTGAVVQAAHHANTESKGNCADGLIGHYFATQEALAADNLETAQASAKLLMAAHKNNPCAQGVGKSAQNIMKASSIEDARVAFKTLSDTVIPLVEQNGVSGGEAHLVHCPMAFEFSGASWLQKDKSVANPYFGSEMFSCGAVKESFGQAK